MATSKKASGGKTAPLDELQPEDAAAVLKRLLTNHPELLPEAEQIWRSTLCDVSFELIAFDVECAIRGLDLDDLNSRAGRKSCGYVEPSQAAVDLLKAAVAPFMEELNRKQTLGLDEAAFEIWQRNCVRRVSVAGSGRRRGPGLGCRLPRTSRRVRG